mgnify:CR=1 FL=1
MLKPVDVPNAPKPVGPYSSAMIVGNLVYVSGQSGRDPVTDSVSEDIEAQTEQVLTNAQRLLSPDEPVQRGDLDLLQERRDLDALAVKMLAALEGDGAAVQARLERLRSTRDEAACTAALAWADAGNVQLICSVGSNSTAFVHQRYSGGKLPVVTVVSKDPVLMGQVGSYDKGSGTNIAFTSLNMPMDTQIAYLRQVRPDLKNIGVLYDRKNASAVVTQVEPQDGAAKTESFRVLHIAVDGGGDPVADLKQGLPAAIETMRANDPSLANSVFWITGSTAVFAEIAPLPTGLEHWVSLYLAITRNPERASFSYDTGSGRLRLGCGCAAVRFHIEAP